jgi:hypothetical protein
MKIGQSWYCTKFHNVLACTQYQTMSKINVNIIVSNWILKIILQKYCELRLIRMNRNKKIYLKKNLHLQTQGNTKLWESAQAAIWMLVEISKSKYGY